MQQTWHHLVHQAYIQDYSTQLIKQDWLQLRPPIEVKDFMLPQELIYTIDQTDGKKRRNIFQNVEYKEDEIQFIKDMHAEIKKQKILLPKNWMAYRTLHFAYKTYFDIPSAIEKMKEHLSWLSNPFWHQLTEESKLILEHGDAYQFGRDKGFRPIIVFKLASIEIKPETEDIILQSICVLLSTVKANMMYPGKIENMLLILDAHGLSLFSIPFNFLKRLVQILNNNYSSLIYKLLFLHPPFIVTASWNLISKLFHPQTAAKFIFVGRNDIAKKLLEYIDSDQLQQKYGGKQPNFDKFWPIQSSYPSNHPRIINIAPQQLYQNLNLDNDGIPSENEIFYTAQSTSNDSSSINNDDFKSFFSFSPIDSNSQMFQFQQQQNSYKIDQIRNQDATKTCGLCNLCGDNGYDEQQQNDNQQANCKYCNIF